MRDLFTKKLVRLDPGGVASGVSAQARILRINKGLAWVTIAGVSHDYWLSEGDALRLQPGRLVVVEAQTVGAAAQTGLEASLEAEHAWSARILQTMRAFLGRRRGARPQAAGCSSTQCRA